MKSVLAFFASCYLFWGCGKNKPQNSEHFVENSKIENRAQIQAEIKSSFSSSSNLYQRIGTFVHTFIDLFKIEMKDSWPKVLFQGDGIRVVFDAILNSFTGQILVKDGNFDIVKPLLIKNRYGEKKVIIKTNGSLLNGLPHHYTIHLMADNKEFLLFKKSAGGHKKFYLKDFLQFAFPEEEIARELSRVSEKLGLNIELNFDRKRVLITSQADPNKDIPLRIAGTPWVANLGEVFLIFDNNRLYVPKDNKLKLVLKSQDRPSYFKFYHDYLEFKLDYKISSQKEVEFKILKKVFDIDIDIDFNLEKTDKVYRVKYANISEDIRMNTKYFINHEKKNIYQELGSAKFYLSKFFNFHVHDPKLVLQSNTLDLKSLKDVVDSYGIKSVIDLNDDQDLPRPQYTQTLGSFLREKSVKFLNIPLSRKYLPNELELLEIISKLDRIEKPMLIISKNGLLRSSYIAHKYLGSVDVGHDDFIQLLSLKLYSEKESDSEYMQYFEQFE
jgi:hypothetical protein